MPTNPNDNKGGDLAELMGLENTPARPYRVERNNDLRDMWQRQATDKKITTARSRVAMDEKLSDKAGLARKVSNKPVGDDPGRTLASRARATFKPPMDSHQVEAEVDLHPSPAPNMDEVKHEMSKFSINP